MGGSEDRSRCRKNLQKDADGRKLCPEYRVAGKKQGLWFPVLSLPGKGSSPCAGSPPRYHRLVPSLPQALWQQWKWAVGYKDTRSKWFPCLSCTKGAKNNSVSWAWGVQKPGCSGKGACLCLGEPSFGEIMRACGCAFGLSARAQAVALRVVLLLRLVSKSCTVRSGVAFLHPPCIERTCEELKICDLLQA